MKTALGGSIHTIASGSRNYDNPLIFGLGNHNDSSSQTLLRLTAAADLGPAAAELHLVQGFEFASAALAAAAPGGYRLGRATWAWAQDDDTRAALALDRLNLRLSGGELDLTIGRQAITFAQAWFWNPLDIFRPFDPAAFDRDYKAGVDALRADLALGDFSTLTLVATPGRELFFRPAPPALVGAALAGGTPGGAALVRARDFSAARWYGSAVVARYSTNLNDWDLSLQGGKIYGGTQVGIGLAGEIGALGLRAEASLVNATSARTLVFTSVAAPQVRRAGDLVEDHLSLVIGCDHRFDNSLYLNAEYFFNGAGVARDDLALGLARQQTGLAGNLSRQLAGLQMTYDFHPLVTAGLVLIHSLSDASTLLNPGCNISLGDETELVLGALLARGPRPGLLQPVNAVQTRYPGILHFPLLESEFGSAPDTFYLEIKFYF